MTKPRPLHSHTHWRKKHERESSCRSSSWLLVRLHELTLVQLINIRQMGPDALYSCVYTQRAKDFPNSHKCKRERWIRLKSNRKITSLLITVSNNGAKRTMIRECRFVPIRFFVFVLLIRSIDWWISSFLFLPDGCEHKNMSDSLHLFLFLPLSFVRGDSRFETRIDFLFSSLLGPSC